MAAQQPDFLPLTAPGAAVFVSEQLAAQPDLPLTAPGAALSEQLLLQPEPLTAPGAAFASEQEDEQLFEQLEPLTAPGAALSQLLVQAALSPSLQQEPWTAPGAALFVEVVAQPARKQQAASEARVAVNFMTNSNGSNQTGTRLPPTHTRGGGVAGGPVREASCA